MIITSTSNEIVKETAKLLQKKYRDEKGLFLIEGEKGIEDFRNADALGRYSSGLKAASKHLSTEVLVTSKKENLEECKKRFIENYDEDKDRNLEYLFLTVKNIIEVIRIVLSLKRLSN